jgi:putative NAD(P)-binding protein
VNKSPSRLSGEKSPLFPMFVKLARRRCLVVGAGKTAEEKIPTLLRCGATVIVVAPAGTGPSNRRRSAVWKIFPSDPSAPKIKGACASEGRAATTENVPEEVAATSKCSEEMPIPPWWSRSSPRKFSIENRQKPKEPRPRVIELQKTEEVTAVG